MNWRICFFTIISIGIYACESNPPAAAYEELSNTAKRQAAFALSGMEVAEGLEVTMFASEPMLINPTNIDIDARGRVWVCEAFNYRNRLNPDNPYRDEGDRILILEDTDGDGKADSKKVFYQAEDINSALGIAVLGNKVYVSHSPNILVFTDENGDDIPDQKDTLFTGMGGDQHDHGVHAVIFGHDGRLYFNYGNEGSKVVHPTGEVVRDVNTSEFVEEGNSPYRQGMAFRLEEDGSNFEVLGNNFRNNYELALDSYGTIWQSDNDDDGNKATRINYVMEYGNYGFKDEMTGANWRQSRVGMHEEIPKRHWHLNDPGVVPNLLQTGSGSPTGMVLYEGDLLPKQFRGQMIHCEPGHNVVRSYPVQPDGAGYKASIVPILEGKDQWFRPSDVCVAPDGSLLVSDWYDPGVGGHKMGDIERGRIYRIAPKRKKYKNPPFDLSSTEGRIAALLSPNMARRYLGFQALKAGDEADKKALMDLWENGRDFAKARALWLLSGMSDGEAFLSGALQHDNPNLRIAAIRAMRMHYKNKILPVLKELAKDPNRQVKREVALALRNEKGEAAAKIWATLAMDHDGQDRWYLEALGIGSSLQPEACFDAWLVAVQDNWDTPAGRDIVWRTRAQAAIPLLKAIITNEETPDADLPRYFRAFDFHKSPDKQQLIAYLIQPEKPGYLLRNQLAVQVLDADFIAQNPTVKAKVKTVLPSLENSPQWLPTLRRLGISDYNDNIFARFLDAEDRKGRTDALGALFDLGGGSLLENYLKDADEEMLYKTVEKLRNFGNTQCSALLAKYLNDEQLSASTRLLITDVLGSSWDGQIALMDLDKKQQVPAFAKNTAYLRMSGSWNGEVSDYGRQHMADIAGKTIDGEKLPTVKRLVSMEGTPEKGQSIFGQHCANCHQVNGEGIEFGPDLSGIGSKLAPQALFEAIIYPSNGINFGYEGWLIERKDGSFFSGYISSETETEITLRMMGGATQTIPVAEIKSRKPLEKSLMTEGLPALMTQSDLVDLVSYLQTLNGLTS